MSASPPIATSSPFRPLRIAFLRSRWLREPLLHFVALGFVLFAVDHYLIGDAADPRRIVVGRAVDDEARQIFVASRGREPDANERAALRQVWLDNEVLYREGIALQVDKGDTAIRERVIFKALSVVDANVKLPPFDDRLLNDWFERHRDKYDEPARFDFEEAALTTNEGEAGVRAFVAALRAGTPGDAQAGLRVFKGRPQANLLQSYGADFAAALAAAPIGEWRAQQTRDGWRAIRVIARTPPRPARFDLLRNIVLQDWTDATLAEQRSAAVRALANGYRITYESDAR